MLTAMQLMLACTGCLARPSAAATPDAAAHGAPDTHPVTRHSPVRWANGVFPTAVPTRGVPDGPIA
eukprot:COSAG02_NODE_37990_length_435_cov_0.583333_1_plen_65_part_01